MLKNNVIICKKLILIAVINQAAPNWDGAMFMVAVRAIVYFLEASRICSPNPVVKVRGLMIMIGAIMDEIT